MGNVFSSCCDQRKSHTPYDPFIYDEEYEEYHSPNILNPNVVNTYQPPAPILLEQTNYRNSDLYSSNNNNNNYNQQQQHHSSIYYENYAQQQYESDNQSYQPFPDVEDDQNEDVTFETNYNDQYQNESLPTIYENTSTTSTTTTTTQNITSPTSTTTWNQPQQPQQQTPFLNTSNNSTKNINNNNGRNFNNSSQDKFYPRYMNFTESVYMAQPPSSELGITDSVVDSLVFGLENKNKNNQQAFYQQPSTSPSNTSTTTTTTTTSTTTTTASSSPSVNTNNANILKPTVITSPPLQSPSTNMNDSNMSMANSQFQDSTLLSDESLYYDAQD